MNEMDQLARFRDTVPAAVSPLAEELFRAGLREERASPHPAAQRRRPYYWLAQARPVWRLAASLAVAAAVTAGIVVLGQPAARRPSAPVALTAVRLLADRASAAALRQPAVSPGQWVYKVAKWGAVDPTTGRSWGRIQTGWETANSDVQSGAPYGSLNTGGSELPSYAQLGSLPRDPAALDSYLWRRVYPHSNPPAVIKGLAAFSSIRGMLENYVVPPALGAELYQALADIPAVTVERHVSTIDGRTGVALVLPHTRQSEKQGIILNASTYRLLARAVWQPNGSIREVAVVRSVIVAAPGSTKPSLTPPSAAQLLAEQADRAVTVTSGPGPFPPPNIRPSTWILRKLATSSGVRAVWATADDLTQASYVNGQLRVCSRSAACAKSTQWLMPAGPSYRLVNPQFPPGAPPDKHLPPQLPATLQGLLGKLNTYRTGCSDVAGDCNAVNAMTNMLTGYANPGAVDGDWFLLLGDIPGATVQHVTDVTRQSDIAFRFPFSDGVTEILFSARTHSLVGFVRDGVQTVITNEAAVSAPGSFAP